MGPGSTTRPSHTPQTTFKETNNQYSARWITMEADFASCVLFSILHQPQIFFPPSHAHVIQLYEDCLQTRLFHVRVGKQNCTVLPVESLILLSQVIPYILLPTCPDGICSHLAYMSTTTTPTQGSLSRHLYILAPGLQTDRDYFSLCFRRAIRPVQMTA